MIGIDSRTLRAAPILALGLLLACGPAASSAISTPSAPTVAETTAQGETAADVPASVETTVGPSKAAETPGSVEPTRTPRPTVSRDSANQLAVKRYQNEGWDTDFSQHSVPFSEIFSGGPPRDGIPPLDNPTFVSVAEADDWLRPKEPVILFEIDGEARAYPLQILIWHEIVNDELAGIPIAVTFCPLCNSAITFDRRLDGVVYDFGTSGKLRNSDLVMWDRQTESWWQQLTGEAIVGELNGSKLKFLASTLVSWNDFKSFHPNGRVLSKDTGFGRRYGQNPYVGYDQVDNPPFLFQGPTDGRLLPKERVAAVSIDGVDAAFPFSALSQEKVVNYTIGGQDLVVFFKLGTQSALDQSSIAESRDVGSTAIFDPNIDGRKLSFKSENDQFVDNETSSVWNLLGEAVAGPMTGSMLTPIVHANHFWFAWGAFKPDTLIYQGKSADSSVGY